MLASAYHVTLTNHIPHSLPSSHLQLITRLDEEKLFWWHEAHSFHPPWLRENLNACYWIIADPIATGKMISFCTSGEILSSHFLRYWFGIFSEQTHVDDKLYDGRHNSSIVNSCDSSEWYKLCPKHKHYNRDLNTKQNILCNAKSGLEIIRESGKGETKGLSMTNVTSRIEFVYTQQLSSSYKILLDTSKVMGDNHRWRYIRRSLHRFIQLLPIGSVIRYVQNNTSK